MPRDRSWERANPEKVKASQKAHYEKHREQRRAAMKAQYEANRDKYMAASKAYVEANREKVTAYKKQWYLENREHHAAKCKQWKIDNAERYAEYKAANIEMVKAQRKAWVEKNYDHKLAANRNRAAMKRMAAGTHTAEDVSNLLKKQRNTCAVCKSKFPKSGQNRFHVDHVMPLILGGSNGPENLQVLCKKCNCSKNGKHPDEFAKQRGLLFI